MKIYLAKYLALIIPLTLYSWGIPASDDEGKAWLDDLRALEAEIEAISKADGPFTMRLFEPFLSLAELQIRGGELDEAENVLRQAQNIAHRNEGVYTPRQLEVISMLTDLALVNENFLTANKQKKFAFFVTRHHLGKDNPEGLYAYVDLAEWYMYTGQPNRARRLLEDAIDLAGDNGEETLRFTLMIDQARRLQGICCSTKHLAEIIDIENRDETDPDTLVEAYLTTGDAFILARKTQKASVFYQMAHELAPLQVPGNPQAITIKRNISDARQSNLQAYRVRPDPLLGRQRLARMTLTEQLEDEFQPPQWFILDADDNHVGFKTRDLHETSNKDRRTQSLAGNPIVFEVEQLNNLLPLKFRKATARAELRIELAFRVTETGDLKDIDVIESNAPSKLDRLLIDALKKVYFRPALENGIPVATDHVTLVQTFSPVLQTQWSQL